MTMDGEMFDSFAGRSRLWFPKQRETAEKTSKPEGFQ